MDGAVAWGMETAESFSSVARFMAHMKLTRMAMMPEAARYVRALSELMAPEAVSAFGAADEDIGLAEGR